MGGKVLELESDRLIQQGHTEVIQIIKLLRQGMTIDETAQKLKLPEEVAQQIREETEGISHLHFSKIPESNNGIACLLPFLLLY